MIGNGNNGTITKGLLKELKDSEIREREKNYIILRQVLETRGDLQFLGFLWGCPRGVLVKAMDCGILVSEFVFQSRYYVHFRANILGKGMNPLILPAMG